MNSSVEDAWVRFWDNKAGGSTDFDATGRGNMDVPGFLYTVREIALNLDLRRGDRFVDIGCGTGIIALALSPFVEDITAIDFSPAIVKRARDNLSCADNVSVLQGSIETTGLDDGSADKLLAYSVLQYLTSEAALENALKEIARVLKPGGRGLLAGNPDPARRRRLIASINAKSNPLVREQERKLVNRTLWVSPDSIRRRAEEAGFEAKVLPIHPRIWQHFYMFDLAVTKIG